jgi:hypothetical protein
MTTLTYSSVDGRNEQNVRKALRGSVFGAPTTASAVTAISTGSPPTLNPLPSGYVDFGQLSDAGAVLGSSVTQTDVMGWGRVVPVRTDITANKRTLQLVGLECNAMTFGLYFQTSPAGITPNGTTGEVQITENDTPTVLYWRMLALAVDVNASGEIYLARFFPNCSVTKLGDIKFDSDKDLITFDATVTAYEDSTLGFSSKFMAGGPGWQPNLTAMGFA